MGALGMEPCSPTAGTGAARRGNDVCASGDYRRSFRHARDALPSESRYGGEHGRTRTPRHDWARGRGLRLVRPETKASERTRTDVFKRVAQAMGRRTLVRDRK